jgi:hypothetical protein
MEYLHPRFMGKFLLVVGKTQIENLIPSGLQRRTILIKNRIIFKRIYINKKNFIGHASTLVFLYNIWVLCFAPTMIIIHSKFLGSMFYQKTTIP